MISGFDFHQYEGGPSVKSLRQRSELVAADPVQRLIPCPGGCGGEALTQRTMTLTRNGSTYILIPATCRGDCRQPVLKHDGTPRLHNSKVKTKPKSFLLDPETLEPANLDQQPKPKPEANTMTKEREALQRKVRKLIQQVGLTQQGLSLLLGFSRTVISQFLCGHQISKERIEKIEDWVAKTEADPQKKPEPPTDGSGYHARGVLIWIDRPGVTAPNQHCSASGVCRDLANHIVVNDGTIEDLHRRVLEVLGE